MQAVKKAVKSVVEKEYKRILVITLAHDDQLVVKGDNMSYLNLEEDVNLTTALKRILTDRREEEETTLVTTSPTKKARILNYQRCLQK